MPFDALPPGFDNSQKGDWNFWPFRYIRPSLTAFGPRCTEWWAKWREFPTILFAKRGKGPWRSELTDGYQQYAAETLDQLKPLVYVLRGRQFGAEHVYLSAIQYFCRWHIQFQWPLFFAIHWYKKSTDVPEYPNKPTVQPIYFRIGARRNADGFYDFPSAHIGGWN